MNRETRRLDKEQAPVPARPVADAVLPQLVPLIRVQMAKRGVRSVRALYQKLALFDQRPLDEQGRRRGLPGPGLRLSLAQLHALVNGEAKQINVEALCAISAVLQCGLADLYEIQAPDAPTKDTP